MSDKPELAETVDLTNCDREPIHILGEIQSFGCLMEISQKWTIARISMNARQFFDEDPRALLNRPLDAVFSATGIHTIRNLAGILRDETSVERSFGVQLIESDARFDIALHFSKGNLVLEFEPSASATREVDASVVVRRMIARVSQATGIEQLLQEAARQVRGATGFDRVMSIASTSAVTAKSLPKAGHRASTAFSVCTTPPPTSPRRRASSISRTPSASSAMSAQNPCRSCRSSIRRESRSTCRCPSPDRSRGFTWNI